ncbi:MAG: hypothetical protein AB1457_12825 [Chloroflexota bacterium]
MNQQVLQAEIMRQQISQIINSVDRTTPKPSGLERAISTKSSSYDYYEIAFTFFLK